jgi:Predicted aminomethyltransferase related to GcvT
VFAHSQFSSDVSALPPLHWQWSSWLSAKGRVRAVFQLLRVSETEVLLVLADGGAEALAAELQRFVFRRKVKLEWRQDLAVAGAFTAPEAANGAAIADLGEAGWELDLGSDELPRTLRIGPAGAFLADEDASLPWPGARPTCALACRGLRPASTRPGPRNSWGWTGSTATA